MYTPIHTYVHGIHTCIHTFIYALTGLTDFLQHEASIGSRSSVQRDSMMARRSMDGLNWSWRTERWMTALQ